jgi:hypothetical protein
LERLVALRDRLRQARPSPHRWYFVATLCATLAVLGFLGSTSKPSVPGHLLVTTDAVRFTLSGNALLNDGLGLREITAADLVDVVDEDSGLSAPVSALRVSSGGDSAEKAIWTEPISLGARATVEVSKGLSKGRTRAIIDQPGGTTLALSYRGRVMVAQDAQERTESVDIPRVMTLRSRAALDLVLFPADAAACLVCRPVPIDKIEFASTDLTHLGIDLFDSRYSPVRSAEIRFDDLPEKVSKIGARELLNLEIEYGTLRRITTGATGEMVLEIDGNIKRLETGSAEHPRDLRPSRLKWLLARETATAVWAGVVYLCGLLLAIGRWWGFKV